MTATQAIQIFGRENVSAATYMAAHASELDGLEQSITGTGKASEMAATQTDTYQGAMGELSSAVEEAEIALGSVLLPIVTDTIDLFTSGVTAVTNFGKSLYDAYQDFQAWLAGVDENFLKLMGIDPEVAKAAGAEAAENTAAGITESDTLKTATGDALSSEDAKAATETAAAEQAAAFDTAFWSNIEQLQSQGVQSGEASTLGKNLSDYYAAGGTGALITGLGKASWKSNVWTETATVSGVEVGIHHDVTAQGSKYTLRVDGKDTSISRFTDNYDTTPREDLVLSMLSEAGLSTDKATALDLANKPLEAAKMRLEQESQRTRKPARD